MVPGARRPPDRTATYRQESLLYQDIRPASRQPPGCQVAWTPPLTTRGLQPPNTPLRSRSRRTRSTGSRSRISTIESIPQSPIQQARQSAPQQLLTGMGIDGTTPPQRHGHRRDFGRIERTTDSQAFPPTVEATIHAHREDNKPLTPPQKISQPDLHSLEQALQADLDQSCPPRAQPLVPPKKLVPGAKRAAADLSKHERARRL